MGTNVNTIIIASNFSEIRPTRVPPVFHILASVPHIGQYLTAAPKFESLNTFAFICSRQLESEFANAYSIILLSKHKE